MDEHDLEQMTNANIKLFSTRDGRKPEGTYGYRLPKTSLSPRETEVCKLLVNGMRVKEVARQLNITIRTVDAHAECISEIGGTRPGWIGKTLR